MEPKKGLKLEVSSVVFLAIAMLAGVAIGYTYNVRGQDSSAQSAALIVPSMCELCNRPTLEPINPLNPPGISNTSVSLTQIPTPGGAVRQASVEFRFTLTNTNNRDMFISKIPGVALSTSTEGSVGLPAHSSSTLTFVTANPSAMAADTGTVPTSGFFVIPSGNSRSFIYQGQVDNKNGVMGLRVFKITGINYRFDLIGPTRSDGTLKNGLQNLVITTVLTP